MSLLSYQNRTSIYSWSLRVTVLPTVTAMSKVPCYEVGTVSGAPRSRSAAFILIDEPLSLLPRRVNTADKV